MSVDEPMRPDPDLFTERAAPPPLRQVLGVIGFVVLMVAIWGTVAYLIASRTD